MIAGIALGIAGDDTLHLLELYLCRRARPLYEVSDRRLPPAGARSPSPSS